MLKEMVKRGNKPHKFCYCNAAIKELERLSEAYDDNYEIMRKAKKLQNAKLINFCRVVENALNERSKHIRKSLGIDKTPRIEDDIYIEKETLKKALTEIDAFFNIPLAAEMVCKEYNRIMSKKIKEHDKKELKEAETLSHRSIGSLVGHIDIIEYTFTG